MGQCGGFQFEIMAYPMLDHITMVADHLFATGRINKTVEEAATMKIRKSAEDKFPIAGFII